MSPLLAAAYVAVAIGAVLLVATRDHTRLAYAGSAYGLLLVALFLLLDAPDVALAYLAVSVVGVPFMILVTATRIGRLEE